MNLMQIDQYGEVHTGEAHISRLKRQARNLEETEENRDEREDH